MTKEEATQLVEDWKYFWMDQTQNSEEDRKNYFSRAFGVDANMQHHLAGLISKSTKRQQVFVDSVTHIYYSWGNGRTYQTAEDAMRAIENVIGNYIRPPTEGKNEDDGTP
jgi:hypothetical protein